MKDFSGSAMIALLPTETDWCKIELPHLTLVYAGEIKDLRPSDFNEMAKDASALSMISWPVSLKVSGTDVFGDEDKVNVLRFHPSSELLAMRRAVESWNASEYPFNPHVTIGPIHVLPPEPLPMYLTFDRILVSWGEDNITFWLKR